MTMNLFHIGSQSLDQENFTYHAYHCVESMKSSFNLLPLRRNSLFLLLSSVFHIKILWMSMHCIDHLCPAELARGHFVESQRVFHCVFIFSMHFQWDSFYNSSTPISRSRTLQDRSKCGLFKYLMDLSLSIRAVFVWMAFYSFDYYIIFSSKTRAVKIVWKNENWLIFDVFIEFRKRTQIRVTTGGGIRRLQTLVCIIPGF